jgi:hypothetical protein
MIRTIIVVISLTISISQYTAKAQDARVQFGIGTSLGFSENRAYYEKVKNVQVLGSFPSSSSRFYTVINMERDSPKSWMSLIGMLQTIKFTLSASARSAIFEVDNTPNKVDFSFVDLDAVIQLFSIDFSDQIQTYMATGPYVGLLLDKSERVDKMENIQPGYIIEFGLKNRTGSFFGFFYMNTFSIYSPNNIALYLGISFQDVRNSAAKAIRKRKNG